VEAPGALPVADPLHGEFNAAWESFQGLKSLRLMEDTLESEWTRGRHEYLAFLIPIEDTSVRAYASQAVGMIADIPGVEPYPEDYWHITIKGIGFRVAEPMRPDEVGEVDVQRIAAAARDVFSEVRAFDVQTGAVNAFPEVVILEVWNSLAVRDLNCRLMEQIPGLLRYPFDGAIFLPHVSIARFTSNEGLLQLKETLAARRGAEPGPVFSINRVDFIRARLTASAPTFETIASYHLRPR